MTRLLYRAGRFSALHPWRVIGAWVLIAVVVGGTAAQWGGEASNRFTVPGAESQQAYDLLAREFPAANGSSATVVFRSEGAPLSDPANAATVAATVERLKALPRVASVDDPARSTLAAKEQDGRTGFATVTYDMGWDEATPDDWAAIQDALEPARATGLTVEVGGDLAQAAEQPHGNEAVGLAVAVVVLFVALGSLIGMVLPIGLGLFALAIGLAIVTLLNNVWDIPTATPTLAAMIGLGVGIDYCLFVLTRHRQFLGDGHSVSEAAGRANATSGQAVVFAGATVVIAICGLALGGLPSVATMGYATAIVVAIAVVAAITLLPAFLGLAGMRINGLRATTRARKATRQERAEHATLAGRWADHVGRRPWPYALLSLVALLALAAPVLGMRIGFTDQGVRPAESTERKAYDLITEHFGAGFNGRMLVAVEGADHAAVAARITEGLSKDPGVRIALPPIASPNGRAHIVMAVPATGPSDAGTTDLVHRTRDTIVPAATAGAAATAHVGGVVPTLLDLSEKVSSRLPVFIGAIVALSFVLLMIVFRSLLVPLKAAIMNLISIGAAYGIVVMVFQWGWGSGLLGIDQNVSINPFVPMMMFAILFGLSMDYEVFLLSRVREEWVRRGDSHDSVVVGLAGTARVITSAAVIMISVFLAFVGNPDVMVKIFGVGLAVAVFLDATVVRMVLVPSTMALLGDANWWLPRWLDRVLPKVDVEGEHGLAELDAEASDLESASEGRPSIDLTDRPEMERAGH